MRSKLCLCGLLTTFALITSASPAAMVTLNFAGAVDDVADDSGVGYVPSGIKTGSSYVGTVTFNNAAVARSTDATDGYYSGTDLNMTVNILVAGQYDYLISTPSSSDEIDLEGSSFGLYKRGPSVDTSFSPNPPFSHLDLNLQTDTDVLAALTAADVALGPTPSSGVSDAQTPGAGYYYVGATLSGVPEPLAGTLALLASAGLIATRRTGRI